MGQWGWQSSFSLGPPPCPCFQIAQNRAIGSSWQGHCCGHQPLFPGVVRGTTSTFLGGWWGPCRNATHWTRPCREPALPATTSILRWPLGNPRVARQSGLGLSRCHCSAQCVLEVVVSISPRSTFSPPNLSGSCKCCGGEKTAVSFLLVLVLKRLY